LTRAEVIDEREGAATLDDERTGFVEVGRDVLEAADLLVLREQVE